MSLATLAQLKTHLGISGSTEDTALKQFLGGANALIRTYANRYLGGVISANTLANPTVVTAVGHGLVTGQTVYFSGSNSTPTLDGERVVTVTGADTFSVPVNVTVAGTSGYYALKATDYYGGKGTRELLLRETPVISIASVYEDPTGYFGDGPNAFASETLLTAGTDYTISRDGRGIELSASGILYRIGSNWPNVHTLNRLLHQPLQPGVGNVKVTYIAGFLPVPADLTLAAFQVVANLRLSAGSGGVLQQESLDYYSYTRATAAEAASMLGSAVQLLKRYRRVVL